MGYFCAPSGKVILFDLHLMAHPLVQGWADDFKVFSSARFPVLFEIAGAYALPPMFGPDGLAAVLDQAVRSSAPGRTSFTLEIHQVDGRLPWAQRRKSSATGVI